MFTIYAQGSMLTLKFIPFRVFPAFLAFSNTPINSCKYTVAMSILNISKFC